MERYEQTAFQKIVAENFEKLTEKDWKVIDADKSVEDLHKELEDICLHEIENAGSKLLKALWTDTKITSNKEI